MHIRSTSKYTGALKDRRGRRLVPDAHLEDMVFGARGVLPNPSVRRRHAFHRVAGITAESASDGARQCDSCILQARSTVRPLLHYCNGLPAGSRLKARRRALMPWTGIGDIFMLLAAQLERGVASIMPGYDLAGIDM